MVLLIWVALVNLMLILAWAQKRFRLHPETARKSLHVAMGLTAVSFPWIFTDVQPVITVVSGSALIMLLVRSVRAFEDNIGKVIGSVARRSLGEFYFAAGIGITFILAYSRPAYYFCI